MPRRELMMVWQLRFLHTARTCLGAIESCSMRGPSINVGIDLFLLLGFLAHGCNKVSKSSFRPRWEESCNPGRV